MTEKTKEVLDEIHKLKGADQFIEFCDEIYTFEEVTKEIIYKSDYIYATLPETPKTINIFDANFFNSMNKNAVFINIGRGTAVVEKDIADALNNNTIRCDSKRAFRKKFSLI